MSRADLFTAAGYVLIAGDAGLLAYLLTLGATKWRGIRRSVAAFCFAAVAACGIGLLLWNPPVAEVRIRGPAEGTVVNGEWLEIKGTVSPPDADVTIFVHASSRYDEPWWIQPAPIVGNGAWTAKIQLGLPDDGAGEYFQILAVASPRPDVFDLLHYQWLDRGTLEELPALPRSEILTVWRAR